MTVSFSCLAGYRAPGKIEGVLGHQSEYDVSGAIEWFDYGNDVKS